MQQMANYIRRAKIIIFATSRNKHETEPSNVFTLKRFPGPLQLRSSLSYGSVYKKKKTLTE